MAETITSLLLRPMRLTQKPRNLSDVAGASHLQHHSTAEDLTLIAQSGIRGSIPPLTNYLGLLYKILSLLSTGVILKT